jgi:hypothetical protein
MEEIINFNNWLGTLSSRYRHRIVICGNHEDPRIFKSVAEGRRLLSNATEYLMDTGVIVEGIHFWGLPWVTHMSAMMHMKNFCRGILLRPMLLLFHLPPHVCVSEHSTSICKLIITKGSSMY